MRKLLTTFGILALGLNVNAQVDLGISGIIYPEPGATYPGLANGDTAWIAIEITNFGSTAITPTDTIYCQVGGIYVGTDGNNYLLTFRGGGFNIPGGGKDTFLGYTIQGEVIGTTGSGVAVSTQVAANSEVTYTFVIYARDASGSLIIESDFTPGTEPDTWNVGENNEGESTVFFEGLEGIFDRLLSTQVDVYPNPTQNELNVKFSLNSNANVTAKISDLTGRVVKEIDLGILSSGDQNIVVPVADLSNGNYMLEILSRDMRGVSKFTVTK